MRVAESGSLDGASQLLLDRYLYALLCIINLTEEQLKSLGGIKTGDTLATANLLKHNAWNKIAHHKYG